MSRQYSYRPAGRRHSRRTVTSATKSSSSTWFAAAAASALVLSWAPTNQPSASTLTGFGTLLGAGVVAYVPKLAVSVSSSQTKVKKQILLSSNNPFFDNRDIQDDDGGSNSNKSNDNNNDQFPPFGSYIQGGNPPSSSPRADNPLNSPYGSYNAESEKPGSGSSKEDENYFFSKFAKQEQLEEERRQKAAMGLQERTAALLREAEEKRLSEKYRREQYEEIVREAEQAVQEEKQSFASPQEANAKWEAESRQRVADAAEAARRKSDEMRSMYSDPNTGRQDELERRAQRAEADAAAAARAKAEELRRRWEAENPQASQMGVPFQTSSSANPFDTWAYPEMPKEPTFSPFEQFPSMPNSNQIPQNSPGVEILHDISSSGSNAEISPSADPLTPFNPPDLDIPSNSQNTPKIFNPFGGLGVQPKSPRPLINNQFGSYRSSMDTTSSIKQSDDESNTANVGPTDGFSLPLGNNPIGSNQGGAVFTPLDAEAFNREAEEEEKARMEEFRVQQEAAIRAEEQARMESDRQRAEEARRQEQQANRLRQEQLKAVAEAEEQARRNTIRAMTQEENDVRSKLGDKRKAEEEARLARLEAARRLAREEEEKEKAIAEERRRRAEQARLAAIEAARKKTEEENAKKKEIEEARKRAEQERTEAARKKADEVRYKAEAENNREEIRNFVESKRREVDRQRRDQDVPQTDDEIRFRAEEARRWAEEEALRKNGGPLGNLGEDEEARRIRNVYMKWCDFYGRRFDEVRLETFTRNLIEIENHYAASGGPVQLNEYADLTPEEYQIRQEDPIIWEENERRLAEEQAFRWEKEQRLRMEEDPMWEPTQYPSEVVSPPGIERFGPDLEVDPWRRDEEEWGMPPPHQASIESRGGRLDIVDEAKRRGAFEIHRKAVEDSKRKEEQQKLAKEQQRLLDEAKARGQAAARLKADTEAKRKAEEDATKLAFEEAQRRGADEAKRKAQAEARLLEEKKKLEEERERALIEARKRGDEEKRRKADAEFREAQMKQEAGGIQGQEATRRQQQDETAMAQQSEIPTVGVEGSQRHGAFAPKQPEPQPKAIDTWNAALQRGQESAQQRAEMEKKRREEEAKKAIEKEEFNRKLQERAREESLKRAEAAQKQKQEADEARKRVVEEAQRRAETEKKKRAEALAKQREEFERAAEMDRQRKEDARKLAELAIKRREEEAARLRADQARKAEEERLRKEEVRLRLAAEAKMKAAEVARRRDEQLKLAMEQQEQKELARRKAAEHAKQRLQQQAQQIELQKAAQLKMAQEDRKRKVDASVSFSSQLRADQERREVARSEAKRQAALEVANKRQAALDIAKRKAEEEATKIKRLEEARQAAREAAKIKNEDDRQNREEAMKNARLKAEKDLHLMRQAAVQYNSGEETLHTGLPVSPPPVASLSEPKSYNPFQKPKPQAVTKKNPFASYGGSTEKQATPLDETVESEKTTPQEMSGQQSEIQNRMSPVSSSSFASLYPQMDPSRQAMSSFGSDLPTETGLPVSPLPVASLSEPKSYNPFQKPKPQAATQRNPFGSYGGSAEKQATPSDEKIEAKSTGQSTAPPSVRDSSASRTFDTKKNWNPFRTMNDQAKKSTPSPFGAFVDLVGGNNEKTESRKETSVSSSTSTGLASFADSLSGGLGKVKESSFMPKTYRQTLKSGLASYLDNVAPAGDLGAPAFVSQPNSNNVTIIPTKTESSAQQQPSSQFGPSGMSSFAGAISEGGEKTNESSIIPTSYKQSSSLGQADNAAAFPTATPEQSASNAGIGLFADTLSGGSGKVKESSFMPKSYRKSSGTGLPSYLASSSTATPPSFSSSPAPVVKNLKQERSSSRTGNTLSSPRTGMSSYTDTLRSGTAPVKKSPYMPKSYKQTSGAGLPTYLDNISSASPPFSSPPLGIAETPSSQGSGISSSNQSKGGPTPLDDVTRPPGGTFMAPPSSTFSTERIQPNVPGPPKAPSSDTAGTGMTSYADSLSGSLSGKAKKGAYMPKSYKQPSDVAGLPSYLDNVGSAGSFTPPPVVSSEQMSITTGAGFFPSPSSPPSPTTASATSSPPPLTKPRETAGTGMPSYMDKVVKSYVAGSDRLEKLNQDIVDRMNTKNREALDGPDAAKSSWGWGYKDGSPTKQEGNKEVGLTGFLSSIFGGKEKTTPAEQTKNQGVVIFQESADGSFSKPDVDAPNNDPGRPSSLSQGQGYTAVSTTSTSYMAGTNQKNAIETSIPTITSWAQTPEGSIHGFIYGSASFADGAYIITTPVERGVQGGSIVTTSSGSQYRLSVTQSGKP